MRHHRPPRRRRDRLVAGSSLLLLAILAGALGAALGGCHRDAPAPVELGPLMAELQRNSAKLGYSIAAHNAPLARFYVKEVREVLAEVETVDVRDGVPIAATARAALTDPLDRLDRSLAAGGSTAWPDYVAVIDGCNRCHAATRHEVIRILPAQGLPPFNQDFAPPPPR